MDGQRCENCRFFRKMTYLVPEPPANGAVMLLDPEEQFAGVCAMNPPAIVEQPNVSAQLRRPGVLAKDWCGQWQNANPETIEQGAAILALAVLHARDMAAARALADKLTGND